MVLLTVNNYYNPQTPLCQISVAVTFTKNAIHYCAFLHTGKKDKSGQSATPSLCLDFISKKTASKETVSKSQKLICSSFCRA
jgi:catalase